MKQSHFFNNKLLVFQEKQFICYLTNLAYNSVYYKNMGFLKNSRLNSQKNPLNRRKVQNCNETMPFFQCITGSFSEKKNLCAISLAGPRKAFTKKPLIFSKTVD